MQYTIPSGSSGQRLDIAASELSGITRSRIRNLIEEGLLTLNGATVKPNHKTKPGDVISVRIIKENHELLPEDLPLEVLYQDEYLVVVNKPPGMVVYPSAGHERGTLINALAFLCPHLASVGGPLRPGIVHRLDKDTSGVMIVALEDNAYYNLVAQFRERSIYRKYLTLVYGDMHDKSGEISLKIGRSESDRKKMSTKVRDGKEAVTRWVVVERYRFATLIEARLGTGRTHQIRVHFAAIGHPVLGDTTYGKKTSLNLGRKKVSFPRQMLHAETLGFTHPVSGNYMEFRRDMPDDMKEKIKELRTANEPDTPL